MFICLRNPPLTLSISDFAKQIKGASSHLLNQVAPGSVFKWQGAYGCIAVSPRDIPMIKGYILNQETHQAQSALMPEFEPPD